MNARRLRNAGSLRGQLVSNALVSIALPLSLAGAVVFFILNYHLQIIESSFARSREALTRDIAGTDIRAQASNAARQLDEFLIERITEAKAWATARVVVDAARGAHERHRAAGLVGTPIEELEARFHRRKSLGLALAANTYLRQQIAASPFFAEVFFTDRNGFNVALTNPTSDFVQSDETWWQNAWGRFLSVGDIEYDDSAGVWSVEISVRIEDPDTGEPLGVMKSVLAIEPVQHIADRTAQTISGGRVQVATGSGALIAETSSGHDRERIMNSEIDVSEQGDESVLAAFAGGPMGFATDSEWITGYARTGGRTYWRPDPPPSPGGRASRTGIRQTIEGLLPSFLLFDEYSVMSGRVSIPRLQTGDGSALTPSERTTLALVQLADMDLSDFTRDEYEARRASLEAAANQLTEEVFTYWSQNRSLPVEFDVDFDRAPDGDGPFFELRIRNHRYGITLNFNERSHGFTWFFSFLATLSELRDSKRMILPLDEPGLGLHAAAQRDLVRFIDERLARRHQVVYTTHSPFMVASGGLERVRTVEDRDGEGTRVSREFLDHSRDTRIPLQAAFGHELIRVLPAGPGTLLVRGPSDHVYLTAMSGHLEAQGRSYLDPRWTIVPVGGLAGTSAYVGLLGTRSNVAVMADVGGGGRGSTDSPAGRRMLAENGIVRPADFTSRNARGEAADSDGPNGDASSSCSSSRTCIDTADCVIPRSAAARVMLRDRAAWQNARSCRSRSRLWYMRLRSTANAAYLPSHRPVKGRTSPGSGVPPGGRPHGGHPLLSSHFRWRWHATETRPESPGGALRIRPVRHRSGSATAGEPSRRKGDSASVSRPARLVSPIIGA